jgi:putative intracellular protease/amidase
MRTVCALLFPGFELLDAFGPVEMFGALGGDYRIAMVAEQAGPIASNQGPKAVADYAFSDGGLAICCSFPAASVRAARSGTAC